MKRGWKIFWIVCAACAGIGFVCCAISLTLGVTIGAIENRFPNGFGFVLKSDDTYDSADAYEIDDPEYPGDTAGYSGHHEDEHHDSIDYDTEEPGNIIEGSKRLSFNNVSDLDMDVWAGEIEAKTDTALSGEIVIETVNVSEKLCLQCYMDGNELKVVSKKKVLGINNGQAGKITIHMPADFQFTKASLGLAAGYLHVEDIAAKELSVDVGAGEGAVDSFQAYEVDLKCGAGMLVAAGAAEAEVDIGCGVGEIIYTAHGKESDYNYNIDCGVGEITCGTNTYTGLGRSKSVDHHGSKNMDLECGIGTVTVNFLEQ